MLNNLSYKHFVKTSVLINCNCEILFLFIFISVGHVLSSRFQLGMRHWREQTCVRFVRKKGHRDWVELYREKNPLSRRYDMTHGKTTTTLRLPCKGNKKGKGWFLIILVIDKVVSSSKLYPLGLIRIPFGAMA